MSRITSATTVGDLLTAHPEAARAFVRRGMACVGCSMARFETIAEAAGVYSVDLAPFMREIERLCRCEEGGTSVPLPDGGRTLRRRRTMAERGSSHVR